MTDSCFIDNKSQVADILEKILEDFPVKSNIVVRQATFSISEEFIRRIYKIKKKTGAKFLLIIDRKALQKTRLLWQFLANVYDKVFLADSHAKVLIVSSEDTTRKVAVITSQNLTRGNRFESSIVSSDNKIAESLTQHFDKISKKHSVPMHEIMPVSPFSDDKKISDQQDNVTSEGSDPENIKNDDLEYLASIFMPISDIAVIMEVDPYVLREQIATPGSPQNLKYRRGKAIAKAKIRAQEMQLAQLGSPLGVQNVRDNLLDMEEDE